MKKLNFHYLTFILTLIALVTFNWQYGNETFIFFGFAENKEMEIRAEHAVSIENVYVTSGVKVKKGDILLEVKRSGLQLTQSGLNHEVAKLKSQLNIGKADIKASISRLEGIKAAKQSEIQSQIAQLESEIAINKSLIKDFRSIDSSTDKIEKSPSEIRIEGLKKELILAIRPLNSEIYKLRNQLYGIENPLKIEINKLNEEIGYVDKETDKLTILAPSDGIVGTFFCKEGEQLPAFSTLLTFYEENPTQVKGYVLESLILKVNKGDNIIVNSGVTASNKCMGVVTGMGSRIVEIPERLRKNPIFKTYGREILIKIPAENSFLQKEKVILKLPSENLKTKAGIVKTFTLPK